ncbi:NtaA/DmoA family FMN-dependent monooxygenase [Subtercola endophyticus]|uniref:NtaA/DmoA family FMN-dependent monooxygenase n=1 Tax=Subtercola endophyticus TaxID=2895559 RepID=UPI001E55468B|nr:NtaA/DmoA family FMN-dependent monooxygenase [Subtercola endophyticus]UFS58204.1 NtaA/DmoA family FMN-dependent monooxygenase [Subtercola endophyticus]
MKQIHLGVFEVAGPQVGGTLSWPHPRSESLRFHELDHWIGVAKLLDRSGFDFLFFADGFGFPSIGGDLPEMAARGGINFPSMDPALMIAALAHETERLGFVVTSSTGLDHPVQTARRFATLDHLTGGRIGWNIVTGASQNTVAELFGHETMNAHDARYDQADEYLDLAMTLWEGSWEDDAFVGDKDAQILAHRDKLHRHEFTGQHFRSSGYFTVDPSPQRTPVLFQAGTSARGRAYAARNAECVFVQGTTVEATAANVADIRQKAAEWGRDPNSLKILVGLTVTVAPTHDEAVALRKEFDDMQTDEVVAVLYAGNTGIDLLSLDPDRDLTQILDAGGPIGQMGQSNIDRFVPRDGSAAPTVRQILDQLSGRGTRGLQLVGSTTEVADELERLIDATDLDGFLLEPIFPPSDLEDFATLVVPELHRRGRMPAEPGHGSLREQMLGRPGAHLSADHPGTRFKISPAAVAVAGPIAE